MPEAPDILFLMPDQMRGDSLSCLGHPVVKTPVLDRLSQQGVLFSRAYSTVPSCIPARYALLTGRMPQKSGVVGFDCKPIHEPTLPSLLRSSGYRTILVGREMHQAPESGDCGYEENYLGSTYVDLDDYDQFLRKRAPETGGILNLIENMGLSLNHWQAGPWPLDEEVHPNSWIVQRSLRSLQSGDPNKPVFLTTSFYAPHPPLFPPHEDYQACFDRAIDEPTIGQWVNRSSLTPEGDESGQRVLLEGGTFRKAQAGYYGLIEHIDRSLQELIEAFIAHSKKRNRSWCIVFTSDHGEMLGDHGYFRKCEPYEGSSRIPLIFAASPSLNFAAGKVVDTPVCLEDLLPTLADLGGCATPTNKDGQNLCPLLRGSVISEDRILHIEHSPIYQASQAFHALTNGKMKYIWRPHDSSEQLFNLAEDPEECHDLSSDVTRRETVEKWRNDLTKRLSTRPEEFVVANKLSPVADYGPIFDTHA